MACCSSLAYLLGKVSRGKIDWDHLMVYHFVFPTAMRACPKLGRWCRSPSRTAYSTGGGKVNCYTDRLGGWTVPWASCHDLLRGNIDCLLPVVDILPKLKINCYTCFCAYKKT